MFKRLANISIHNKLVWILLLTLSLTMLLATLLLNIYDYTHSKESLESELDVLTKVISDRSRAAISFKDKRAALGNLNSLQAKPAIKQACIFHTTGELFVAYNNKNYQSKECQQILIEGNDTFLYTNKSLYIKQYVYLNKRPIGVVQIETSLDSIYERLLQFSAVAFFILILSGLLAYILTLRLQHQITRPLLLLNETAANVTTQHDYSLRAEKSSNDEVGDLVDSFNSMLHTIHSNEIQLREAMIVLNEKKEVSEAKALSAEDKHAALKEFFAGVSHDLKQPINAMGLFMEAMKRAPSAFSQLELMDKLEQSLINLNQMFTDLLDKSRFEKELLKSNKKEVPLNSIFSVIGHEFGVLASDKNIRLLMHGHSKSVYSDPLMLERIIRNLVSNAIRYTSEGGVLVGARKRKDQVWIEVWDSGQGIPEEKISEIFSAHVQLNNPDHDPTKGFGLGLSIVKKMIDNLGHELEVKSLPGNGTLMRLKIDNNISAKKETLKTSVTMPQISTGNLNDPLNGLNALVIDDDADVLDATQIIVQGWGINVNGAGNYQQALDVAEQLDYKLDVILADYDLGQGQTGARLIEELRSKAQRKIPAVIISGESAEFLQSLADDGFSVLKKPVKAARLRAMINHSLAQTSTDQS